MSFVFPSKAALSIFESYKLGLHHNALLISGEAGVGKRSLAFILAKTALCSSGAKPCGKCGACVRFDSRAHLDAHVVTPSDSKARVITVEQIRELISKISMRSYEGGAKTVIIENADAMQHPAQNALLKSLEEPPGDTFFFLTTRRRLELLPTIRSRCSWVHLPPLSIDEATRVLVETGIDRKLAARAASYAEGSVGRAIAYATNADPIRGAILDEVTRIKTMLDIPAAARKIVELSQNKALAGANISVYEIIERFLIDDGKISAPRKLKALDSIELARKRDALFLPKQQTMEDLLESVVYAKDNIV